MGAFVGAVRPTAARIRLSISSLFINLRLRHDHRASFLGIDLQGRKRLAALLPTVLEKNALQIAESLACWSNPGRVNHDALCVAYSQITFAQILTGGLCVD